MKLIKIIILILTVSTSFAAICELTSKNGFVEKPECIAITKDDVYPEDSQPEGEAKALTQNLSARKLMYNPGKKVKEILKNSAAYLSDSWASFSPEVEKLLIDAEQSDKGVNRQVDFGGSLGVLATHAGLTSSQAIKDMLAAHKAGTATVIQTVGYISFLGDIGAQVNDCFARGKNDPKKHSKLIAIANDVKKVFTTFDVEAKMKEDSFVQRKVDTFYSNKPNERLTCMVKDGDKCKWYQLPRSGVLNKGKAADEKMGHKGESIPEILWPLQTVKATTVNECKDEPWAGLYSGSINELLFMLDLLTKSDPNDTKGADRRAKAAIASALLIATGFHSAVEVVHVVKLYLGEKSTIPSCAGSTEYISALIDEFNSDTDKLKKKKLKMKMKKLK